MAKISHLRRTRPTDQEYRDAADAKYGRDGELEIDDAAPGSAGDDPGAYVQGWVWVYDTDVPGHEDDDLYDDEEGGA